MKRTFKNVPEGQLFEADQQSLLVNLGYSDGSTWDDLLQSKRILLISEAGSGKTYECRTQAQLLWDEGKPSFFIELATLATDELRSLLGSEEEERLEAWLSSQSGEATFFLDSYDELKLSRVSFEQALKRFKKGIRDQLHRVRIVITTRPIPFDEKLVRRILPIPLSVTDKSKEDTFAETAMGESQGSQIDVEKEEDEKDWRTVALMPLSDKQIEEFASIQGIDEPSVLLEDLRKRNAQEFARRPQDLIELCADWRLHKRIRLHSDQVESNVRLKLQPRQNRSELCELSIDQAKDGASRLALAMLVTRRLTLRHSAASDDIEQEAALDPSIILSDWKPDEIKTLLERPLFGFASYGRVRFHHRSVLEFLASESLKKLTQHKGMTFRALKRLLFSKTRGKIIVRPTMRPIAGWLALADSKIFEILRDNEPAVLLDEGDPEALSQVQRNQVLRSYVECFGEGGWRGLSIPHIQIHRFASSELSNEINKLWQSGIENPEVRELLLSIIDAGSIAECADIAFVVAVDINASMPERLCAIDALVAVNDSRLQQISAELSSNEDLWPEKLVSRALIRLFPENISIEQLCSALERVEESTNSFSSFNWQLSRLISGAEFDQETLEEFRNRLVDLVSIGLSWDEDWKPLISEKSFLSDVLAAVCVHGLALQTNDEWLYACVLALRLKGDRHSGDETHKALRKMLADLTTDANRRLFWIEDTLLQNFKTIVDPWKRFYRNVEEGVVTISMDRDWSWIKVALGDVEYNYDDRAFLLETAKRLFYGEDGWIERGSELKSLIGDYPNLISEIDKWFQPRGVPDWKKKQIKRKQQQDRKKAKNKASWIQFRREIINQPEKVFSPEQRQNTAWDLWRITRRLEERNGESGWNRHFFENQFGKETADEIRLMFMDMWRNESPTLPSERPENNRNTYLLIWDMGLFSIYAEAEDPDWVIKISEEEAELAARYSIRELNGLPLWLEQVIKVYPQAVNVTLGKELEWELQQKVNDQGRSMLLQDISYAPKSISKTFLPILLTWLDSNGNITSDETNITWLVDRLRQVIDTLLKFGDDDVRTYLLTVSQEHLRKELPREFVFIWLSALMELNHHLGLVALENQIKMIEPAVRSEAVKWFSLLFGDRQDSISLSDFTPQQLLQLSRLAYQHVRKEDDIVREGSGSFTPGVRDYAERARNSILDALLASKGETGWLAKQELAENPFFAHIKDRILAITNENWAKEIDSETYDETQAVALDKTGEAPASTNSSMFAILSDRLSDLDDLLLSDVSPRDAWAGIPAENIMRREIARELKHAANGLYTVDQEAVTADEKETDIRLRSVVSNHEAVIELKLADGRSARDLRDTISDQLAKKYMAPETSRSGGLLITIAKNRQWDHPDNGQRIALDELILLLQDEAKRVEESMGGSIALVVHILDLRPRLPKENNTDLLEQ